MIDRVSSHVQTGRRGLTPGDGIMFGRHRGTPFDRLPEPYLRWLARECRSRETRARGRHPRDERPAPERRVRAARERARVSTATTAEGKAGTPARDVFHIDRALEFFTDDELTKQIGHDRENWPSALLAELISNGLDAAEQHASSPRIEVVVTDDTFAVTDNGPGIPWDVVTSSLDYTTRTTDKAFHVSPTRGRQGNALKTLWAAPYVVSGGARGVVSVEAHGQCRSVVVKANALIPDEATLPDAYRQAVQRAHIQRAINAAAEEASIQAEVPCALSGAVNERLARGHATETACRRSPAHDTGSVPMAEQHCAVVLDRRATTAQAFDRSASDFSCPAISRNDTTATIRIFG